MYYLLGIHYRYIEEISKIHHCKNHAATNFMAVLLTVA